MIESIGSIVEAIKGPALTKENQQVWYEHQIQKKIFLGLFNTFVCTMLLKFIFQYSHGYTYDECINILRITMKDEIINLIAGLTILNVISCIIHVAFYERRYEDGILLKSKINWLKKFYILSEIVMLALSSIALSLLPFYAVMIGFLCGIVISFCSLVYGYYNKEKVMHLSPIGMGLVVSGTNLYFLNLAFGNLTLVDNISSVISILGAVLCLLFYGGGVSYRWEQVQEIYKDYPLSKQEKVLKMVVYIDTWKILLDIRYIIARIAKSSSDN